MRNMYFATATVAAVIILLCGGGEVSGAEDSCAPREAVLESEPGSVQVLALVDLHGPGMDGTPCSWLDTEALVTMEAFTWMVRELNKEEPVPGIKIGYTVYDTCKDPTIISRVMSSLVNQRKACSEDNLQFAVVVTSLEESTHAAISWLSLLRIPHIVVPKDGQAVLNADTRDKFSTYTLAVPDASHVLVQALPEMMSFLNSSYAATLSGGRSMNQLADHFRMKAPQSGLCLPKHISFNPVTAEMVESKLFEQLELFPSVKAAVAFLETEDMITFKNAASRSAQANNYFWMLVSNSSEEIDLVSEAQLTDPAQNFLIVRPHHVVSAGFRQYFLNMTTKRRFDHPYMREYMETTYGCYFDMVKAGRTKRCSQLSPAEIEREYSDNPRVSQVMKALKAVISSVEDAWTRKCRGRDGMCPGLAELGPEDLMKYLSNVKTSLGRSRREMVAVRFEDGIMSRGVAISILSFGTKGTRVHQLGIFEGGRIRMNQSAFEVIKSSLPKSTCDRCNECRSVDERKILYTDRASDAYFTGVFYPAPEETVCSLLRVQAMETFYLALQMGKDAEEEGEERERFPGLDYGATIMEDEGIYASAIKSTLLPSDERITPPIHTLGRVYVSLSPENPILDEDLPVISFQESYGGGNIISGIAKYLKSQGVNYASLVHDGESRDAIVKLRKTFATNEICLATALTLKSPSQDEAAQIEWIVSQLTAAAEKTAYCVITSQNADTIHRIISGFNVARNSSAPYTWVVASPVTITWPAVPTHHKAITVAPPGKYRDALQNHFNQITGYDISVKTWLADYYRGCSRQRKTADIAKMSDAVFLYGVLMAARRVVRLSDARYHLDCGGRGLCEAFFHENIPFKGFVQHEGTKTTLGFDVPWDIVEYKQYAGNWRGQTFGTIDEDGDLHGVGVTDSHDKASCETFCPHCLSCSDNPPPSPVPVIKGELNIAALLHAHKSGANSLDCGVVCYDNEDMQLVEGFLYAVETAQSRNKELRLWKRAAVGGLVLDTCSSLTKAMQTITNVEGCAYVHEYENGTEFLPPQSILVYLATEPAGDLGGLIHHLDKVIVGTGVPGTHLEEDHDDTEEDDRPIEIMPYYVKLGSAIMDLLITFNWTYIGIVLSEKDSNAATAEVFIDMISDSDICVGSLQVINDITNTDEVVSELDRIKHLNVVILLTTAVDTIKLLNSVKHHPTRHFQWILLDSNEDAVNVVDVRDYALGAVAVRSKVEPDPRFRDYYQGLEPEANTRNTWFADFWERKFKCRLGLDVDVEEKRDWALCTGRERLSLSPPHPLIPYVFESVDMIVKAIDAVVGEMCPDTSGLCAALMDKPRLSHLIRERLHDTVQHPWPADGSRLEQTEFTLHSFQLAKPGLYKYVQIAKYQREKLELDDEASEEVEAVPACPECMCLNLSSGKGLRHHLSAMSSSKRHPHDLHVSYIGAIWITVVLTIAGIGVIVCFVVIAYIIYKKLTNSVENGTVMGVLLLLGIALLYASTITFAAPPNAISCGLRIFLVAFAYTFCYGVILLKAMNLRSIRFLGIGGEVSRLNEYLSLSFILAVQVALTTQWWLHHPPLAVIVRPGGRHGGPSPHHAPRGGVRVCSYSALDYAQILIYPLLVLLIAAVYAITVRQMKQNCHEIRFLLIACWMCIVSSFTWYLVLVVGSESVREPTICVGALVCATLMLVAIFLPKVHLLATMKYNLNKIAFDGFGRNFRGSAPRATSSTEFTFYDVSGIRPKSVNRVNFNEGRHTESLSNNYKF